nr:hypothetical protein [Tanacetum cinerariifolium]
YRDEIKIAELKENFNGMSIEIRKQEKLRQLDQWANLSTSPSKRFNSFCYDDDDDEDYTIAVTPSFPIEKPDNSLSMGDEHLDTIPATESDKFIKSSVENLIPITKVMEIVIPEEGSKHQNDNPIPSYDPIIFGTPPNLTPSGENLDPEGDMLLFESFLNDDPSSDSQTKSSSTSLNSLLEETNNFHNSLPECTTFSHVLYDAECESDSSDDQSCSDEDVLEKIADCDFEEDIRLIEKFLYDNSSPRPPEEFVFANSDATTESFSPSPILVKNSDSLMEEIDLFCTPDYPIPPGIEDEDSDSERDILIPKDLPSNNSLSFAEKESVYFDIPSFSRPPVKPPDGDTGILNIKMMGDISDQKAFMHKLMITLASQQEKSLDLLSHRGIEMEKRNIQCRNVLSMDLHRAFSRRLKTFKAPMR